LSKLGKPFGVMGNRVLIAISLFFAYPLYWAHATEWYVSTAGNDSWSGRLSEPNETRTDGPFASLLRAREALRHAASPKSVRIRAGTYELPEGFVLDVRDSGTAENPIVWSAYEKERPRLIGGRRISEWKIWKNNIWMSDLSSRNIEEISDLYVNGERQVLARYPNLDPSDPVGSGWAYVAGDFVPMYQKRAEDKKNSFQTKPGDWRNWARPQDAKVFVFPRFNWWNNILDVKEVDPTGHLIATSQEASYAIRPGDRYYFEGPLEELDAPREWTYDKRKRLLYFMPHESLSNADAFVATARNVIVLRQGVHHVVLQNLSVECATGSAVRFEQTTHCRLLGCRIRNIGDYSSTAVVVQGGADNGISHCEISDVGGSGIALSGGDIKSLTPSSHFVESCKIYNVGVRYKQGVGIALSGVGQRVSHCLLHHMPRFAILFGGNNQTIEYNHIHDVVLETEDAGAVYCGGRDWITARGSVVRYNYIHDIPGFGLDGNQWRSPCKAWGIYLDDNAAGVDVTGNVVTKCGEALLHGHSARDCHIENNIFVGGSKYQWEFNGWTTSSEMWINFLPAMKAGYESVAAQAQWKNMRGMEVSPEKIPDSSGRVMSGNVISRNIFLWDGMQAMALRAKAFSSARNRCDRNLYWNGGNPVTVETDSGGAMNAIDWRTWQESGADQNSLVANPELSSYDTSDFRPKPNSPVWKLAFRPIPFEEIGPGW
jgi:hypothetical protein